MRNDEIVIRPLRQAAEFNMDAISVNILEDLLSKGFTGEELLSEYR